MPALTRREARGARGRSEGATCSTTHKRQATKSTRLHLTQRRCSRDAAVEDALHGDRPRRREHGELLPCRRASRGGAQVWLHRLPNLLLLHPAAGQQASVRASVQRPPLRERLNALVLRVWAGLRRVAEAHALAHLRLRGRRQLHGTGGVRNGARRERSASAARSPSRTSSTFSCASSEAARSMPKDLTPRMLRAFRLHSTTTSRPCERGRQHRSARSGPVAPHLELLLGHVTNQTRADLVGERRYGEAERTRSRIARAPPATARTCRGSASPTSTSSTNSFSASGCFHAWRSAR